MTSKDQTRIFLLLIVALVGVTFVSAEIYDINAPYLRFTVEEVTPEPVEPGQDLVVKLRLSNDGGKVAEDVSLKLNAEFPFFVKTESNNFEDKKTLCVGCSISNTYYLIVDANAKSGLYPLTVDIYSGSMLITPSETINIKIVGKPDIVLRTDAIAANVSPGDMFVVPFDAKNIGTGIARNIKITPQSDSFLMLGSNINLLNELLPEQTISFSSEFMVKESLSPDTYKFPVKLDYVDEQGNSHTTSFDIGINVLNRADLSIQSIKIKPIMPTQLDDVHMDGIIENTGKGNADKVTVELTTAEGKTYKSFIGQLRADDDAPFYFDAKPDAAGMRTATLKVTYNDDFGSHTFETSVSQEVKKPTNNLLLIIAVIVLIVAGGAYFYFKKKS